MHFVAFATMLFAAVAVAGPIALPDAKAVKNIEVITKKESTMSYRDADKVLKHAVREAEPILGERASCTTTSCGIATGCPAGCGGCIINPYFGGGMCSNK